MKNYFFILFLFFHIIATAQSDCPDAITVCGNESYRDLDATGIGFQEISNSNACSSGENNSLWLLLHVNTGGTLGFTILPDSDDLVVDFDFWIFGPNATCGNLGTAIRCSTTNPIQSDAENNLTGMNETETDVSEGPGPNGNNFIQWLTVQDNETYYLIIDRPHGASNFSIEWTGTATFFEVPVFNNPDNIPLDLVQCEGDTVNDNVSVFDLTVHEEMFIGTQTNVVLTYHESQNDMITGENPLENPAAYVNSSNPQTVYLRMTNTITGCYANLTFDIEVSTIPAGTPENLALCDDNLNGLREFNLALNDNVIKNGNPGSTVTYYASPEDAQNGVNPIGPLFQNTLPYTTQTIWARLQDANGCFGDEIKSFDINILPLPVFVNPGNISLDMSQCDADTIDDSSTLFDLTLHEAMLIGGQTDVMLSYYETVDEAILGENFITNPDVYANTSTPQTIYIRMTNTETGCFAVDSFDIEITVIAAGEPEDLNLCDISENGFREFNLSLNDDAVKNGLPDTEVAYYTSLEDAENETGPIGPLYQNEVAYEQEIWARIENTNGCHGHDIVSFNLVVVPLPVFNNPDHIPVDLMQCDADGTDDNSTPFNLTVHAAMFIGGQPNRVITYYESQQDADSETNPITVPTSYANTSNPQTIYMRMEDTVHGCFDTLSFEIEINNTITAGEPEDLALCDTEENGLQVFNLALNDVLIKNSTQNTVVTYYTSQQDAENETNPIGPFYQNPLAYSPQVIWARLERANGCFGYDIKAFTISILPLPAFHNPDNFELDMNRCDDDGVDDNSTPFDLTLYSQMLIGGQTDVVLTYHENENDAASGSNAIENTASYSNITNPQTIYMRIADTLSGCYRLKSFELSIPVITAGQPPNLTLCDFDENGIQVFDLTVNDEAVRNGNPDTAVTYYASQADAESGTNPIGPLYANQIAYFVQPVWARLDSTNGCLGHDIVMFTIGVPELPEIIYSVAIDDFTSNQNSITISMGNIEDYEFSYDGVTFSDSNILDNLMPGLYTIYIRSKDGCKTVSEEVAVLNYPKFFTPNGDGHNDHWRIPYLYFYPAAVVTILDRYGKVITGFRGADHGWDGTYNGEELPSTDYWFILQFADGRNIRGHFAMVR